MSKTGFRIRTSTEIFDREEIELLSRYGRQYERLMTGDREPETPGQQRFVEVCRGDAKPESEHEKVWRKYLRRLEWEADPSNLATKGPPRKAIDPSFGGSREEHKAMRSAQFADLRRRWRD